SSGSEESSQGRESPEAAPEAVPATAGTASGTARAAAAAPAAMRRAKRMWPLQKRGMCGGGHRRPDGVGAGGAGGAGEAGRGGGGVGGEVGGKAVGRKGGRPRGVGAARCSSTGRPGEPLRRPRQRAPGRQGAQSTVLFAAGRGTGGEMRARRDELR